MSRGALGFLVLCVTSALGLGACEASGEDRQSDVAEVGDTTATRRPKPSGSPSRASNPKSPDPSPAPGDAPVTPAETYRPNEPLPDGAGEIAAALEEVHRILGREVRTWLAAGGGRDTREAEDVELAALFQQRLYRKLARQPRRAPGVLARLEGSVKETAAINFEAGHRLSAGIDPVKPPVRLRTTEPADPQRLLAFYEAAERRFGVPWTVLASVNFVETRFGRILGPSSAGALGPMQFLPSTWQRYGAGGDIMDPHDAILGAARYLRASGAPSDIRGALFAYNQSTDYVDSVLDYAGEMRRRPNAFYEYYFWQVFVRTTKGDVQLTGPGADPRP